MGRSRFRTERTRDEHNTGGETRLQMRLPSGTYATIAHFKDAAVARSIVKLLNRRSAESEQAAAAQQRELLPVVHKGDRPNRLKSFKYPGDWWQAPPNPEAFYAHRWTSAHKGRDLLGMLLVSEQQYAAGVRQVPYSRRDAFVAATLVQWLGTNVGRGFVLETERAIDEAQKRQHEVGVPRRQLRNVSDPLVGAAARRKDMLDKARKRLAGAAKGAK